MEKQNPSHEAGVSGIINALPGPIDKSEITGNLIHLQAERLRRRFILSEALAIATAELAFPTQGRFA